MSATTRESISLVFTSDEQEILAGTQAPIGRGLDVLDVIVAWALHVEKFLSERSASLDDPRVWGADDLIAALYIRDALSECMEHLPLPLKSRLFSEVVPSDDAFMKYTEHDEDGLIERVVGHSISEYGWWWKRVPREGPVRTELQRR